MQSLIDFLSAYEPMYRQIVRGYSSDEITRFEQALGRPVPSVLLDFLSTAAANLGFIVGEVTFDIDELIDLATMKRGMLEGMKNLLTPVGFDLSPTAADYYIHMGRPVGDGDGEIVRSGTGSIGFDDIHSDPCLRDMLFFLGFHRVRMLPLVHRRKVAWYAQDFPEQGPVPNLDTLHVILKQLGFQPLNVTGPTLPLYERGDCAVSVSKNWTGQSFSVYVAAQSQATTDAITDTLIDSMPGQGKRRPYSPNG